jgi:hypothetical protein
MQAFTNSEHAPAGAPCRYSRLQLGGASGRLSANCHQHCHACRNGNTTAMLQMTLIAAENTADSCNYKACATQQLAVHITACHLLAGTRSGQAGRNCNNPHTSSDTLTRVDAYIKPQAGCQQQLLVSCEVACCQLRLSTASDIQQVLDKQQTRPRLVNGACRRGMDMLKCTLLIKPLQMTTRTARVLLCTAYTQLLSWCTQT